MRMQLQRWANYPELFAEHKPPEYRYAKRSVRFGYGRNGDWVEEIELRGITSTDCTILIQALLAYRDALEEEQKDLAAEVDPDACAEGIVRASKERQEALREAEDEEAMAYDHFREGVDEEIAREGEP